MPGRFCLDGPRQPPQRRLAFDVLAITRHRLADQGAMQLCTSKFGIPDMSDAGSAIAHRRPR